MATLEPAGPSAHVVFELEVDADGWPPVGTERLWAHNLGSDRYRIDNVPWFVSDVAVGDVVRAVAKRENDQPVFAEVIKRSEHLTIRIICFRSGPLEGDLQRVVEVFTPLGVYAEGAVQYGMVALDVPPATPLAHVHALLQRGVQDGSWEYDDS